MLSDVEKGNNLMLTRLTPVATLFPTMKLQNCEAAGLARRKTEAVLCNQFMTCALGILLSQVPDLNVIQQKCLLRWKIKCVYLTKFIVFLFYFLFQSRNLRFQCTRMKV